MKQLTVNDVGLTVKVMAETALENEKYFSDLDAAAGDADFGVSLAGGFGAILKQWEELDRSSIGTFLMKLSMIITSNTGGCSGPIWGTAFMKAGILSKDKETIDLKDLVKMLHSSIEGVMARGGAQPGDKTLLDALVPLTDKLEEFSQQDNPNYQEALSAAAQAAHEAIEITKSWEAKRGRQSFTGERSIGTPDPGIVAVATMMHAIAKVFDKEKV